ncbi:NTF2-like protein [Hirsutella rhossiliensis]|uniref:NTF2-like protein n=1 Tax=Hirsutella rhossiliensis TaxID=111463 RepID=A0A9P8N5E5_9HYPO|nr:NTF2-like protein [Hirsutella rhossiliensis]KAH0967180.1 NTF2-like protein [Hirsutella rhossiliensis]
MAAVATYEQFLAAPSSSLLADKATLHYVTTTTTFSGATDILKHLNSLQRQIKKKKQNVLGVIDGNNVIALEVDTDLEFLTSGGPYLPGLDDNFLSDRTAYLPIMHIVAFDADGKIIQMRQQWDQGSLLKQLEIIGKTGRNWPIKDSREQLSMIRACLESAGLASSSANQSHNDVVIRTRGLSANALRDPHASLELFAPREQIEAAEPASVVSPYAGNRPRQRGFTEILGDEPQGEEAHNALRDRSVSPSKVGQGKNYQPMRIFDGQEHHEEVEDETSEAKGTKSYIRPNPRKYEHFDFADGSDPQDKSKAGMGLKDQTKSKHNSQWSFDDFVTPQKPKPSKTYRHQDTRSWDTEDDGESVSRQERPGKPRGSVHNEGLGLYKNNINRDDATPGPQRALGNITNLKDRTKDFDPHFAMTDDSPSAQQQQPQAVPEGRQKAVKMMDANWSSYDQSPSSQKENQPRPSQAKGGSRIHIAGDGMGTKKGGSRDLLPAGENGDKEGIHIAGDGMGGKKGTDRNWLFGGDEEGEAPKATTSRKGNGAAAAKSFWAF